MRFGRADADDRVEHRRRSPLDDDRIDHHRGEATALDEAFGDGAESLLNELTGAFDLDEAPPPPPQVEVAAAPEQEIPVTSPPRVEPPAMIWKPSGRARFKLRLR
jgi:hypothetical protein